MTANLICGGMYSSSKSCRGGASCNPRCCTQRQLPSSGRFRSRRFDSKKFWIAPRLTGRRWSLIRRKNICHRSTRAHRKHPRHKGETQLTRSSRFFRFRGKRTIGPKPSWCRPISSSTATFPCPTSLPRALSFRRFSWMLRDPHCHCHRAGSSLPRLRWWRLRPMCNLRGIA